MERAVWHRCATSVRLRDGLQALREAPLTNLNNLDALDLESGRTTVHVGKYRNAIIVENDSDLVVINGIEECRKLRDWLNAVLPVEPSDQPTDGG